MAVVTNDIQHLFFPDFIVELDVSGGYIRHRIIFALGPVTLTSPTFRPLR